ncbi:MAG: hypothetical protein LBU65_05685, partial [Planctomycetaceae bacterium]|nr:hypothetical protein [Planctomycetaceae bacterium]
IAFRAELLISPAEQLMAIGQNGEDAFTDAIMLLEKSDATSQPHPMLVAANRRLADALTRQWKLAKAEQYWLRTQQLAVQAALSQHGNERLSRLCEDAVHAKLALAEYARYSGDLNTARFSCRDLIGGIHDTLLLLDTIEEDVSDDKQRLTEQLAAAMEILADCTLFVPTHFGQHSAANSRFFRNEAQTWYANAREITSDVKRKFVLQCKLALLEYSNGDLTEERHNEIWQEIKNDNSRLEASYLTSRRTMEYYDVIDIFFGQTSHSNINCIRNWLDEKRLNSNAFDRYVGERLDLQLFCINSLLKEIGQRDNELYRQDIERYLDPILLQHLVSEVKMRPFLMPFYDLAIMRLKDEDLPQTVLTIRAARAQLFGGTLPKVLTVFYFPLDSSEGFAIFLPLDRQQGKRFDLGFNRQDVIDAAVSQRELKLPDDLVTSINDAISQSSRIDISWDDSVCWTLSQGKNRLPMSTSWIFSSQLPKDILWGIVR